MSKTYSDVLGALVADVESVVEDLADPMAHSHSTNGEVVDCLACILCARLAFAVRTAAADALVVESEGSAEAGEARDSVTLSLEVRTCYLDGNETVEHPRGVTAPAPESFTDAGLEEWATEHLFPHTGTGREGVPATYSVSITHTYVARLRDRTFVWEG